MSERPMPEIRAATGGDWPALERLLRARLLPLEGAREHLDGFLVALDGPTVVGAIGIERYGEVGLLRSLAVAEKAAGQGVGRRLVRALLEEAPLRGIEDLYLLTTTAADYFPRFGFERIPRAALPAALSASEQLRGACPAAAVAMRLRQAVRGAERGSSA
jgi:amino-acid N-acetyltransferase